MHKIETVAQKGKSFVKKSTCSGYNETNKPDEKPIPIQQALFILKSTNFNWCRSPTDILQDKLQLLGLGLAIFEEDPILFYTFKHKLAGKFRGNLKKFQPLLGLITQKI